MILFCAHLLIVQRIFLFHPLFCRQIRVADSCYDPGIRGSRDLRHLYGILPGSSAVVHSRQNVCMYINHNFSSYLSATVTRSTASAVCV